MVNGFAKFPGFVDDCDRLCFEADQLLLLSQEKENEGDLAMALTLSDCAASKARAAMDAPYNNSKSIMTAKMKHSTCVMRSCSLHRRLAQEMKEAKATEGRHSRQSSRDSTKSNKSSKEKSPKDTIEKQNKNSIDIYGTLPKKHSRRRCNSSGSSIELKAAALRANKEACDLVSPTQEVYMKSEGKRTVRDVKHEHKHKKLNRDDGVKYKEHKKQLLDGYLSVDAADYSDYYSEWDEVKKPGLSRTYSGSQTIKDASAGKCKDDLNQSSTTQTNKKQHKVRRKLLMGGLIRRKNRSMPDLTDTNESFGDFKDNQENFHSEIDSVVRARGFLQPHPAFVRSGSKLPQPNRLPPPPPIRIPSDKIKPEPQTIAEAKKSTKIPKLAFSAALDNKAPTVEMDRSKSPLTMSHFNEYPEYMNLQNIQMKINSNNCDQNISPPPKKQFYDNNFHQQVAPSQMATPPQYMNTMDYMNMCKSSSSSNHVLDPPNTYNHPEYMNLQYLREIQNNTEGTAGPGSLPLPPPPSPHGMTQCVTDLPLPPPPEQLLPQDESDGESKPSPFLLELRAKKEELEKKALEKLPEPVVAHEENKSPVKKSAWLEELQAKQTKMLQKKQTEQKNTGNERQRHFSIHPPV